MYIVFMSIEVPHRVRPLGSKNIIIIIIKIINITIKALIKIIKRLILIKEKLKLLNKIKRKL